MSLFVKKGVLFTVGAYACFAAAAFLIKIASAPLALVVFCRSIVGFSLFFPFFLKKRSELRTNKFTFHFMRSLISLATIYCSTFGIQKLRLADAILLEQTAPFFIPGLLFFWKGKHISLKNISAMLVGACGVALILKPNFEVWNMAACASLGAGFLVAVSILFMQYLLKTESIPATLFYFLFFSSALSLGPAVSSWEVLFHWPVTMILILVGAFFALFQFFLTRAVAYTDAQLVGSYAYLTVLFSFVLGSFFLGENLTFFRCMGAFLIIMSGLYTYRLEMKKTEEVIS